MATIKDVAARAGVSFTTVSHVINKTRPVADETRERVERAIEELGYAPNMVARGLRLGETKTVGVVGISSSDLYFAEVLHGIQERGWEDGFGIYISYSDLTDVCPVDKTIVDGDFFCVREVERLGDLEKRNIQGLILNSVQPDIRLLQSLKRLTIPCILFQRLIKGAGWDNFVSDDYQGATAAMRHLIDLGHRRIALIEGYGYESHTVKHRKRAWADALRSIGVEPDQGLVRDGRYDSCVAYAETRTLLALPSPPTAILYYSDTMALAGIRAANDLGLSVPEDLSIVGYDNLHLDAMTVPRLTSVSQSSAQFGRDMMERLAERVAQSDLEPIIKVYPQNLVIRESTGEAHDTRL